MGRACFISQIAPDWAPTDFPLPNFHDSTAIGDSQCNDVHLHTLIMTIYSDISIRPSIIALEILPPQQSKVSELPTDYIFMLMHMQP